MAVLFSTVIGARTGPAGAGTSSTGSTPVSGAVASAAAEVAGALLVAADCAGFCAAPSSAAGDVNDHTPRTTSATTTTPRSPWTARRGAPGRRPWAGSALRPGPADPCGPDGARLPVFLRAASAAWRSARTAARPPTGPPTGPLA